MRTQGYAQSFRYGQVAQNLDLTAESDCSTTLGALSLATASFFGDELVELFDYIADIDRSVHVVGFIDLVVSHLLARSLVAFLFLGKCQIRLAFRT